MTSPTSPTGPTVNKLQDVDAFIVIDMTEAETADGLLRCAPKVLVDSTKALARSRTYSWALLGQPISGASAGINATPEQRTAAIERFCTEMAPEVGAGRLVLAAGKGVGHDELAPLGTVADANPDAFVRGVITCAETARNRIVGNAAGLDSATVGIEFDGGAGDALVSALESRGAKVVSEGPDAFGEPADILFFGSKAGVLDHNSAATIEHRILVPTGALAFSPRALAVAQRRDVLVLPDFLTTAGALAERAGSDPAEALSELTSVVMDHDEGAVLGACLIAEGFLSSWSQELPFGRPIG